MAYNPNDRQFKRIQPESSNPLDPLGIYISPGQSNIKLKKISSRKTSTKQNNVYEDSDPSVKYINLYNIN